MKTSEQVNEIFAALSKAQGEMKNPEKNKTATISTKTGGKYTYNYADLPVTYDVARTALAQNGLSHFSAIAATDRGLALQMRLAHSSGQWIESEIYLPDTPDPKTMAANLTYFRRYLFTALVGVAADEDLDSEPEHESAQYQDRKPQQQPAAQGPAPQPKAAPSVQPRSVTRVGWSGGAK